jgi:hypothetical protein
VIRQRKPIERSTKPLPRSSKPLKRSRLKQGPGPKAEREKPALDAFRTALIERSHGQCEAPPYVRTPTRVIVVPHSSTARHHAGAHAHHQYPEDHDRGVHDPTRGLYCCTASHDWAHRNPDDGALAGILRPDRVEREGLT